MACSLMMSGRQSLIPALVCGLPTDTTSRPGLDRLLQRWCVGILAQIGVCGCHLFGCWGSGRTAAPAFHIRHRVSFYKIIPEIVEPQ